MHCLIKIAFDQNRLLNHNTTYALSFFKRSHTTNLSPCATPLNCHIFPIDDRTKNANYEAMKTPEAKKPAKSKQVYQLKITLVESKPKIWRRVLVPDAIKLGSLHQVIQIAMGWQGGHLHNFEIDGTNYSHPHPDTDWGDTGDVDYRRITLKKVAPTAKAKFSYLYDFGDGWEHEIVVEKIIEGGPAPLSPLCVAGERACPPEDVGGVWGYAEFLKALREPKHPEHARYLEWIGGAFDPEAFDPAAVNQALDSIRL